MDMCGRSKLTPCKCYLTSEWADLGPVDVFPSSGEKWVAARFLRCNQPGTTKEGPVEPPSRDLVVVGQGAMEAVALLLQYFQWFFLEVTGLLGHISSCSTTVWKDKLVTRPLPIHRIKTQWVFLWGVDKRWSWTSGGDYSGLWPWMKPSRANHATAAYLWEKNSCVGIIMFLGAPPPGKPHPPGPRMTLVCGDNLLLTSCDSQGFLVKS